MSFIGFPSKLLENAVNEFASLPGIGRKTAFRLVMNLLRRDSEEVRRFGESLIKLHEEIHYCKSVITSLILRYAISVMIKPATKL